MIQATLKDRTLVTGLLAKAFEFNQSVNYIVKHDGKRKQRIQALMEYSFDTCLRSGEIFLSENQQACALVQYPHLKKPGLYNTWLDIKLIFKAIGLTRIGTALDREKRIKQKQPPIPMCYLWFIGVEPKAQMQSTGSGLLQELLAYARSKGLAVYLETSTESNIGWYQKHDFEIYDELKLSYKLYFLRTQAQ